MEDAKIKEFDRTIEKMMNESSVPPPYGMWNRIASQIGAAPEAAPVSTATPGNSFIMLMTGMAMIGASVLTAYLVSDQPARVKPSVNSVVLEQPAVTIKPTVIENPSPVVSKQPLLAKKEVETKKQLVTSVPHAVALVEESAELVTVSATEEVPVAEKAVALLAEPAVETIAVSTTPAPPLAPKSIVKSSAPVTKSVVNDKDEDDDEPRVNQYGDKKLKYKPKRKKPFNYGRINRRK